MHLALLAERFALPEFGRELGNVPFADQSIVISVRVAMTGAVMGCRGLLP